MAKYKVTDKRTGETFVVDESQVGQYQNPQTSSSVQMGGTPESMKQLLLMAALQDPKNVSKYTGLASLVGEVYPGQTAAEKEKAASDEDANSIITQLEDLYFGSQSGPLAYGRTEGASQRIQAALGNNPDLSTYLAVRGSVGVKLAKAMVDVGNISIVEQENALRNLPTGSNTPEEAIRYFKSMRAKMGVPERDYGTDFKGVTLPDVTKIKPVNDLTKLSGAEPVSSTRAQTGTTPIDERNLLQRIFNTGEDVAKPLPDQPLASEAGSLLGRFSPLPPGIRTAVGSGIGKTIENVAEGVPLTRQAAGEMGYETSPNLSKLAGPLGPIISGLAGGQGYAPKEQELLNEAGVAGLLDLLFSPKQTVTGIRNVVAGRADQPVSTAKAIAEPGLKFATGGVGEGATASQVSRASNLAAQDIAKYGSPGQTTSLQNLLKEATNRQEVGYVAGKAGRGATAGYERAVAKGIRDVIAQQSPVAGTLTDLLAKIIKTQNTLGRLGGNIGTGAVGAAGSAGGILALQRLGLLGGQ